MTEYKLEYNPFTLHVGLDVRIGQDWMPISKASSLARIHNRDIYTWLDESFFDDLVSACGDHEIIIHFRGSVYDANYLIQQLQIYLTACQNHISITLKAETYDKGTDLTNIRKLLQNIPDYKKLFPELSEPFPVDTPARIVELTDCDFLNNISDLNCPCICFVINAHDLNSEKTKQRLISISEQLENVDPECANRSKYVLILQVDDYNNHVKRTIRDARQLLLISGLNDLSLFCLDSIEIDGLRQNNPAELSEEYRKAKNRCSALASIDNQKEIISRLKYLLKKNQLLNMKGPKLERQLSGIYRNSYKKNNYTDKDIADIASDAQKAIEDLKKLVEVQ